MGMGKAVRLRPGVLDVGGMRVALPGLEAPSLASCPVQLHREVLFSLAQCTMPAPRGTASAGRGDSTMWRHLMASTTTSLGRAATPWWGAMNPRGSPSQSR